MNAQGSLNAVNDSTKEALYLAPKPSSRTTDSVPYTRYDIVAYARHLRRQVCYAIYDGTTQIRCCLSSLRYHIKTPLGYLLERIT